MYDVEYDKIQVRDVAEEAGVALGTLYRYFNSKDHLFACALQSWARSFGGHLEHGSDGPTVERVKATYRRAARALDPPPPLSRVLMVVQSSDDDHARAGFREFARDLVTVFGATLDRSRLTVDKRRDVIAVMSAILDENLRSWQLGAQDIDAVYTAIDRTAELIL